MTGNPWPSIAWTAGLIAAFGFLMALGQNISARRAAKRLQAEHDARALSLDGVLDIDAGLDDILNQPKGEK
jgi:hypothetical protein